MITKIPFRRFRLAALPLGCVSLIALSCGQLEFGAAESAAGRAGTQYDAGQAGEPAVAGGASGGDGVGGQRSAGASGTEQSGSGGVAGASGTEQSGSGGAAGASGTEQSGNGGAAGAAGQDSGPMCSEPDSGSWPGCYPAQPCAVCAAKIASFPVYLQRHPRCSSFPLCDHHEPQSPCSADCPEPGAGDQCDGTQGEWLGCRGLGCYVCTELVAAYPRYFKNHPWCASNDTCGGQYGTCSAACPAPSEADR